MIYTDNYLRSFEKVIPAVHNIEALRGSTVLVTGASGLICSGLIDFFLYLNQQHHYRIRIYAAARREEALRERFGTYYKELHFVQYDALLPLKFDLSADYVIHGASNANPRAYIESPVETMLANINGIHQILEYARQTTNCRVLYISTSEVYGNKVERTLVPYCEEDYGDILDPRSCYPSSKRAAETLCASYLTEYGVESVIVRPGHIYGPSFTRQDNRAYAQFVRDASNHRDIVMKSKGTQLRSYCYNTDCVSAIAAVLLNGEPGHAYNISNPDSVVRISDLAECLAKVSGVSISYAESSEIEKSGYTKMTNSSLCSDKLQRLGWFGCFSLEEGCRLTLECTAAEE